MPEPNERDHNLHFWVGVMFAGSGAAMGAMLQGEKLSGGLPGVILFMFILGLVLMARYPLRRRSH